jgi:HAD superfamily hydrolase (TIGR01509 family)
MYCTSLIFEYMQLNTVIFDMDGLLIDSEPYWRQAANEALQQFDIVLTPEQHHFTTGLRTKEWLEYWFNFFRIDGRFVKQTGESIVRKAVEKIKQNGEAMPGIDQALLFFKEKHFKLGLATSSPPALIKVVMEKLQLEKYFQAYSSAENLPFSKPHPQVYLDCARLLDASPLTCLCFEDSVNGLISAKAARMKCVIVPAKEQFDLPHWGIADTKLSSLLEWNESVFSALLAE